MNSIGGAEDAAGPGPAAGSVEDVAAVEPVGTAAGALLARLRAATPDTGDDRTQVALDDALDVLEDHLAVLAGEPGTR